jgi:ABC-type Zn uptake system ZnuABC Zn-binding protein ZnuA
VRPAALLFVVTVLAAGCGGGGNSSSSGGARLSRSDYAAKADAICKKYNAKTKQIGNNSKNLSDVAKAFDRALPLLDNALSELKTLRPPKSEQHDVDEWLAQSQVLKHDLQEMRDKAKAKDLKGVQEAFARASANDRQGNRLAAKLGMKVCSKG